MAILRLIGILLGLFSLLQIPPLLLGLFYADGTAWIFARSGLLILVLGVLLWLPARRHRPTHLGPRDGFLIAATTWISLSLAGAAPLLRWAQSGLD